MDGRAFLLSARALLAVPCEPNWRSAVGRAYYGLLHEGEAALRRWGIRRPPGETLHQFVRRRFGQTPNPDLRKIGWLMDALSDLRNFADYRLTTLREFATEAAAADSLKKATDTLAFLDALDADPVRRAAAVAAIQKKWP